MTQRYNVPAIHTATFPATLTENLSHSSQSCRDIFNAADRRPQTADRRPQTADRRPLLIKLLSRLFIGAMTMTVFAVTPSYAQWGYYGGPPQNVMFNGFTGIGPFVNPFLPSRLLHVHSTTALAELAPYPAFLRLQTLLPAAGVIGPNRFGETGIEFFSGSLSVPGGASWSVGKILGITNGHGLLNTNQFAVAGGNSTEFRGGLAFFCSPLLSTFMPQEGDQIEVMRIVDEKVGIRTKTPLGQLDVNVSDANAKPKVSITNGTTPHLDDTYGGPQLRFYIPYSDINTPADRSSSYSWYIHTMRQKDPACFLGLDGTQGLTWYNTVLSGMHFMSGYNTASHAAGDIYRDNMGSETAIPRMSLLSNGNVGINNSVPMARLQVTNGAVLFEGTQGLTPYKRIVTATTPDVIAERDELNAGTRLMWIPSKAAFRAGIIDGYTETASEPSHAEYDPDWNGTTIVLANKTQGWNSNHIGMYSFSTGHNTRAEGTSDIAMGLNSVANSGVKHGAIAIGHTNLTTGEDAVTLGFANKATAKYGIAIGSISEATGVGSMALGRNNKVSEGFAFGNSCESTDGMAIGFTAKSTGNNAISIGYETINTKGNSLKVGFNEITAGYKASLFVSEVAVSMGCESGQNRLDVNGSVAIGWGDGGTGSISTIPTAPDHSLVVGGKIGINDGFPENRLDVNGSVAIGFDIGASPVQDNSLAVAEKVGIGTISTTGCNLGVDGTACIGWSGTAAFSSGSGGRFISLMVESGVVLGGSSGTPAYVTGTESGNFSFLNVWGDAAKFDYGAEASWDIPSDARYKKEVHSFDDGLQLLKQINPVRFKYSEELGIPGSDKEEGIGVLAQDMQKIAPYTVHDNVLKKSIQTKEEKRYQVDDQDTIIKRVIDYSKVDNSQPDTLVEEEKHYEYKDTTVYKPTKRWVIEPAEYRTDSMPLLTYNPSALTYVIINSIKEIDSLRTADKQELIEKINIQNKVINSQNSTIDSLILANKNFEERIARLETKNEISLNEVSDVILEQNNPNPFSENTTITYYIPDKVQGDAELVIAPAASQSPALQKYPLTKGTPTQLNISAKDLYTGVFVYSITVSGKVIVSKKFIIIK